MLAGSSRTVSFHIKEKRGLGCMQVSRLSICRCRSKCRQSKRRIFEQIAAPSVHATKCSKVAFKSRSLVAFPSRVLELEYAAMPFGQPCPLYNRVPNHPLLTSCRLAEN